MSDELEAAAEGLCMHKESCFEILYNFYVKNEGENTQPLASVVAE
jgi:hypothetical protein